MSRLGEDLVRRYTAEGTSLDEKRTMFKDMLALMKKYQSKSFSSNFGYSSEMYEIIIATPPEIFSFKPSDIKFKPLGVEKFEYPMKLFRDYVELSLKELGNNIKFKWGKFEENTKKNICRSMYVSFAAVSEALRFPQEIYHEDHLENQKSIESFSVWFLREIEKSEMLIEEALENVVDLRKHIRKIANSSEETFEKLKKEFHASKVFVESVTLKSDAMIFRNTADNHRSRARISIGIAILLGAIGLAWGALLSDEALQEICGKRWFCMLSNVGVRGFLLATSILIIGIYASIRSYFAHSQSEANNRQRLNALESYEKMLKLAPDDNEARNLILQKAVECIYSHQATGFAKEQKDNDAKTTIVLPHISTPSSQGS